MIQAKQHFTFHIHIETKLQGHLKSPSQVKSPFFPIELDIEFFYQSIFWIYFIFSVIIRNLLTYRNWIHKSAGMQKNVSGKLHDDEAPSLLNLFVLHFSDKNRAIKICLFLIQVTFISTIFFAVNIQFYDLLYGNIIIFILAALIPLLLSIIAFFFRYDSKALITRVG